MIFLPKSLVLLIHMEYDIFCYFDALIKLLEDANITSVFLGGKKKKGLKTKNDLTTTIK